MEYKEISMIFLEKGDQILKIIPGYFSNNLTYPKNDAILNKIANIFPSKCFKNATRFYQIN
jgi:hypothetical protein